MGPERCNRGGLLVDTQKGQPWRDAARSGAGVDVQGQGNGVFLSVSEITGDSICTSIMINPCWIGSRWSCCLSCCNQRTKARGAGIIFVHIAGAVMFITRGGAEARFIA